MASSHTDLQDADANVDPNVMSMILEYEGSDPVSGYGEVPLVPTLFNTIKTQKLARLGTLITAAVSGNPNEVKKILDKDRSLTLVKWEEKKNIIALSGHQFNQITAYQAALSVGDTQIASLIKSYFDDEDAANRQFIEQCPKGWEKAEEKEKKWQRIIEQRDQKLIPAIRRGKKDIIPSGSPYYSITLKKGSPVEKALFKFWDLLDAAFNEVITVGKRPFYDALLTTTWQIYNTSYKKYFGGSVADPRALLYVQKVIGNEGIQGLMSVNYVQGFQDGLFQTLQKLRNNVPQGRSTSFETYRSVGEDPVNFYPRTPRMSPDSNFMIYGWVKGTAFRLDSYSEPKLFEDYVKQKQYFYEALHAAAQKEKKPKPT